ncbi:MAG: MFS transporter [Chloroflexota bacterium]|nr:MFS transporter [Chloroflexota bacterium]
MFSPQSDSAWSVFRHPQYRSLYITQLISVTGAAMQLAAINWHVWELTNDELALGVVGLVRILPIIVLSLLGGVIADAVDRRKLLMTTQTLMFVFSGILAVSVLSGSNSLPLIYGMTALIAGMSAFDQPARAALMPNLVPKAELSKAVRLNVLMWQVTSVLGPVVAGLLLARVGPGGAYLFNALSFAPEIVVLFFLRGVRTTPGLGEAGEKREISFAALTEGLRFVKNTPLLWSSMLLDFFATFFSSALALLPVYATEILRVGAEGYGILAAAPAIGSTVGAVTMAQIGGRFKAQGKLMLWSVAAYGVFTVLFGVSTSFGLSLILLAGVGLSDSISTVIRGTLRQLLTPDRLRGRMLSVNMIFFMGGPQLGEFEAGALARATTPAFSVLSGGVATVLAVGLIAYLVPGLRRYREGDITSVNEPLNLNAVSEAGVTSAATGGLSVESVKGSGD